MQRYLRYMGVLDRRRDRSFTAHLKGRFRMRPNLPWMPCESWQYNTTAPVCRFFHMRIDFAGFVPMVGRDTYVGGRGVMLRVRPGALRFNVDPRGRTVV